MKRRRSLGKYYVGYTGLVFHRPRPGERYEGYLSGRIIMILEHRDGAVASVATKNGNHIIRIG